MDSNSLFLISAGLLILIPILKKITIKEKKLFYLFLLILFFQLVLVFIMQFDLKRFYDPFVTRSKFFNDGEAYSGNALVIANTLNGKVTEESFFNKVSGIQRISGEVMEAAKKSEIVNMRSYEVGIITFIYAIIYATYGYAPAFLNFINICINIFTALIIFYIAKNNFNRITAYISTTLFLFWPTTFYYSTTKTKGPLIIFCSFLLIFIWSKMKRKATLIFPTVVILLCLEFLRQSTGKTLLFIIILYVCLKMIQKNKLILKLSIFLSIFFSIIFRKETYDVLVRLFIRSACLQKGFVESGGIVYSLYGSNFNSIINYNLFDWLFYLFRGWFHLISEPLFSTGYSLFLIMYFPFKIIFMLLLLFAILGFITDLRQHRKNNFILVLFFLTFGTVYATIEGNVGTMLRHRDLIAPVIFIYGAYFLSKILPKNLFSIIEE